MTAFRRRVPCLFPYHHILSEIKFFVFVLRPIRRGSVFIICIARDYIKINIYLLLYHSRKEKTIEKYTFCEKYGLRMRFLPRSRLAAKKAPATALPLRGTVPKLFCKIFRQSGTYGFFLPSPSKKSSYSQPYISLSSMSTLMRTFSSPDSYLA